MKNADINFYIFLLFIITGCNGNPSPAIEDVPSPAQKMSAQPYLLSTGNELYLSWQETDNDRHSLNFSRYINNQWSDPAVLASGKNWFINWADFPSLAASPSGTLMSHYLPKSGDSPYAYDVNIVMAGSGRSFKLHDDTTQTEHGFVSSMPLENDKFLVTWLDGRNTTNVNHHHGGAMNLRAAIISDSGEKEKEWLLDDKVCDCCQTSVAMTAGGPVVVYRDRSDDEVRDIVLRRLQNGSWSSPEKVGNDQWVINGCPVNGPKIKASGELVAIAWYTGRNDFPTVYLTISNDGGKTFSAPVVVDEENTLGRVDVEIDEEENVWVSYLSTGTGDATLNASEFSKDGEPLNKFTIATLKNSRHSGFPQMEMFEKDLYFAWTSSEDSQGIAIKRMNN